MSTEPGFSPSGAPYPSFPAATTPPADLPALPLADGSPNGAYAMGYSGPPEGLLDWLMLQQAEAAAYADLAEAETAAAANR